MKNQTRTNVKKGLYRLLIFGIMVIFLDYCCGKFLQFLYTRQKSGYQYRSSYAIDSTVQPGLIFGSSRASHHYDTRMLSDSFGMAFYNVGRDGQSILYDYTILQSTLKRYIPKMILLDYQDEELLYFATSYDRLSDLLPYARTHPEVNQTVQLRSGYEKLKMISRVYPYNSLFFNMLGGLSPGVIHKTDEQNGYLPLDKPFHSLHADRNKFLSNRTLDSNKIKAFDAFMSLCRKNGIELYVVISPYLDSVSEKIMDPIDEQIQLARVPHFDYAHFPAVAGDTGYFSDEKHLNRKGSELFTRDLISKIRAYRLTVDSTDKTVSK